LRLKSIYNIVLLFLSIIITLIFSELFYRGYVHFLKPLYKPSSILNLGWELTPGAELIEDNIEGKSVQYFVNMSGFRDRTNKLWNKWKSSDIKILFLGDSVTWGEGIEYERTYSSVVESTLAETNLSVRIVNWGVSGYNTLQYLSNLENNALQINPDIIILGYYINDIERRGTQNFPNIIRFFLRHYHFGTFLIGRIATALENRGGLIPDYLPQSNVNDLIIEQSCSGYVKRIIDSYKTIAWENTKEDMLSIAERCKYEDIKFGVVIFPDETQVEGICPETPQEMLSGGLSKNGIPFLDLIKIFKKHSSETKLYLEDDHIHLNFIGHEVAGVSIAQWIFSEPEFGDVFKNFSIRN